MELNELGNLLNHAADITRSGISHISVSDSNRDGIFGAIKKRLQWILWIFAVTTIIFVPHLISHRKTDFIALFLYLILSIESVISLIAWMQIRAMEHQGENVKHNLLHRIRRLKWVFFSGVFLNSFFYLLLAILLEYSMYRHWDPNFEALAKLAWPIRYAIYLFFIIFQQVIKKRSFEKNYGSYLNRMINISAEKVSCFNSAGAAGGDPAAVAEGDRDPGAAELSAFREASWRPSTFRMGARSRASGRCRTATPITSSVFAEHHD